MPPTRRPPKSPSAPRTTPVRSRRAPAASRHQGPADPLRIVMIASEVGPWAKTGGLADVLSALPAALARLGHQITVVLPRYRQVPAGRVLDEFSITLGGERLGVAVHGLGDAPGVTVGALDCPALYDRDGGLYGPGHGDYGDNPRRFAFLCRAALEWVVRRGERPSIVHAHDWQGGLAPVYLRTHYAGDPVLGGVHAVFTIHNLAYQGLFPAVWLPALDLPWDLMQLDALEYWGKISLLKGGIQFSRVVTTVSPRYALEIQTPEYGCGFDGILRMRADDLVGILNGIDYAEWNPARDPNIPKGYTAANLAPKRAAKREVLVALGLPVTAGTLARPLVGIVSRLADQKGLDLVAGAAETLAGMNASFAVLGSGDPRYETMFEGLAARYPGRFGVRIGFDERLAHLIEAGADLFLMPSRFEPCGLNQMYSLRYGTVPVVRATGGLFDTVRNFDPATGEGTGFSFEEYAPGALVGTLQRALEVYRDRTTWQRLQRAGMSQDLSWDRSAGEYVTMYNRAARA